MADIAQICSRCAGFRLGEVGLRLLDYTCVSPWIPRSARGVSPDCAYCVGTAFTACLLLGVSVVGAPADAGIDEVVNLAVEYGRGVSDLVFCPEILDHLVGIQDV